MSFSRGSHFQPCESRDATKITPRLRVNHDGISTMSGVISRGRCRMLTSVFKSFGCTSIWSIDVMAISRFQEVLYLYIYTFSRGFTPVNIHGFKKLCARCRTFLPLRENISHESIIRPSSESVTTCQGMNLPLACNAFFAASSRPPQHGTSMRTIVTDLMSFSRMISVSFSE